MENRKLKEEQKEEIKNEVIVSLHKLSFSVLILLMTLILSFSLQYMRLMFFMFLFFVIRNYRNYQSKLLLEKFIWCMHNEI